MDAKRKTDHHSSFFDQLHNHHLTTFLLAITIAFALKNAHHQLLPVCGGTIRSRLWTVGDRHSSLSADLIEAPSDKAKADERKALTDSTIIGFRYSTSQET
jgi:hypothetical protein